MKIRKKEIESFYVSKYRKQETTPVLSPNEHFNHKVTQEDASARIRFITNHIEINDKRILEIGSASGRLLHTLREYGCNDITGIELGEEFADHSRRRGFKIFTRPIEELNLREEFDVVLCFFTLEHVYDPMTVIQALYKALKPNGYFLGEVPNQNDWRIQIFNDEVVKRLHYDPCHYYYYSPVTLRNYLETCGFYDIRLETVERYNSLVQLRNILCKKYSGKNIEDILVKYIFPKSEQDDVRLPHEDDQLEMKFNRLFEKGVDSELMGNSLRFIARKKVIRK